MTTLDLDALERAARAAAQAHAPFEIKEGPDYAEVIDRNGEKVALTVRPELFRLIEQFPALTSDYRALQERVERAEKALRPFADFIEQFDAGMIEGVRSMEPDGGAVPDDEILQLISPDSQCRATTGEMAFGRKTPVLPPKQITNGHLRAAGAYFAARTKAGEPHEQE